MGLLLREEQQLLFPSVTKTVFFFRSWIFLQDTISSSNQKYETCPVSETFENCFDFFNKSKKEKASSVQCKLKDQVSHHTNFLQ